MIRLEMIEFILPLLDNHQKGSIYFYSAKKTIGKGENMNGNQYWRISIKRL